MLHFLFTESILLQSVVVNGSSATLLCLQLGPLRGVLGKVRVQLGLVLGRKGETGLIHQKKIGWELELSDTKTTTLKSVIPCCIRPYSSAWGL